jgi:hypothetical protein
MQSRKTSSALWTQMMMSTPSVRGGSGFIRGAAGLSGKSSRTAAGYVVGGGTASAIVAKHGFHLIRHPAALGYTRPANAGLWASDAPWIVFLNSDAVVTPGWLPACPTA